MNEEHYIRVEENIRELLGRPCECDHWDYGNDIKDCPLHGDEPHWATQLDEAWDLAILVAEKFHPDEHAFRIQWDSYIIKNPNPKANPPLPPWEASFCLEHYGYADTPAEAITRACLAALQACKEDNRGG